MHRVRSADAYLEIPLSIFSPDNGEILPFVGVLKLTGALSLLSLARPPAGRAGRFSQGAWRPSAMLRCLARALPPSLGGRAVWLGSWAGLTRP